MTEALSLILMRQTGQSCGRYIRLGGTTTTTYYCGNVIYENSIHKLLLTDAGYVSLRTWHHIVAQNADNIAKFGAEKIHNTYNLIKVPDGKGSIHMKVSGYYSSKLYFANGLIVRKWLNTKNYVEQYKFGIKTLKRYGWKP